MLVHLRRAGAVAFLAAGGALVSSACVANESSFFIRQCLVVPRDTCEVQATTNSSVYSDGSIDALYRGEYVCMALIENQLVLRGNATTLRTETSRISVYAADVQVLTNDVANPQTIAQFTVPVSGFADPGNGTEPGLGFAAITLIDSGTLQKLVQQMPASGHMQVVGTAIAHGRTLGGQELTSNEFKFPIEVTYGGFCGSPSGAKCASSSGMTGTLPADCVFGQDEVVDCRYLNPCKYLNCDPNPDPANPGTYLLDSAHCPGSGLGDGTCCGAI